MKDTYSATHLFLFQWKGNFSAACFALHLMGSGNCPFYTPSKLLQEKTVILCELYYLFMTKSLKTKQTNRKRNSNCENKQKVMSFVVKEDTLILTVTTECYIGIYHYKQPISLQNCPV